MINESKLSKEVTKHFERLKILYGTNERGETSFEYTNPGYPNIPEALVDFYRYAEFSDIDYKYDSQFVQGLFRSPLDSFRPTGMLHLIDYEGEDYDGNNCKGGFFAFLSDRNTREFMSFSINDETPEDPSVFILDSNVFDVNNFSKPLRLSKLSWFLGKLYCSE